MTEGANAGAIRATVDFDAAGLERAVNAAMTKASKTISSKIDESMADVQDTMKSGFKSVGTKILGFLGIEDIAQGLKGVGSYILDIGRETEAALNQFQAVSGATADQMARVSDVANQLGNDISLPGTSAADAAVTMSELAKAGFTVEESMAAAKGSLQLAAAANIDAGEAAAIASEQINAFNLKASDAGKVADLMANAANVSAADMTGMGDSLKQVSAVANAAGLSLTDTTAAIALMANNSIQGSDAGTSLKSMLVALAAPSDKAASLMEKYGINVYDSTGHLKDLSGIVEATSKGMEGLTDQQKQYALATIFGTDAIRAINVLMHEGADGMKEMSEGLTKEGAAAKLAAANSKGLNGSLNALQSTAESLAIEIYQNVSPAIDEWLRGRLEQLPGTLDEITGYVVQLTDNLEPAARLIYDFVAAAEPGAVIAFKAALAAVLGVSQALDAVLSPLVHVIEANEGAFKGIVSAVVAATIAYKVLSAAVTRARSVVTSAQWTKAKTQITGVATSMRSASTAAASFRSAGKGLMGALGGPWGLAITAASVGLGIFAAKQAEAKAHVDELRSSLDAQTGAFTKNTREAVFSALENSGAVRTAKELGLAMNTLTDAALGDADALAEVRSAAQAATDAQSSHAASIGRAANAASHGTIEIQHMVGAVTGQNKAVRAAVESAHDHAEAMRTEADTASRAGRVHGQLSGQVRKAGDSFQRESRAAKSAKAAIDSLNESSIKGLNAQIDFEQAADDLTKQIKSLTPAAIKSGKALDIGTQAGRDTYRAFIDLANASEGVDGGMKKARQQIYNTIRPMVDSKAQANKLTDQFFVLKQAAENVPNHVKIDTEANTEAAKAKVDALRVAAENAAGLYRINMVVNTTHHGTPFVSGGQVRAQATGGPVVGPGTGTSDEVPRWLSNGEHVFTAEEVDAAGGHAGIFAIRRALLHGGLNAVAAEAGSGGSLVGQLAVTVGTKDDLPEALDQTMFHLRRIQRGGRYN